MEKVERKDKLISIIIPYYNTLHYIQKLFEILSPQLDEEIEVFIIDDGCKETELDQLKATVIHLDKNSGGASVPRNVGLDLANGEYILFIDSDDLVTDDYIKTIKEKIKEDFDYCFISWKCRTCEVVIKDEPPIWNTCVWNCIYKRKLINTERFNPNIRVGEDKDFNERVRFGKHSSIEKIIYIYNLDTPNSLTKT